tara:strand:+ start:175 stop:678 length:504 start_codon:yes stop_codon:yes gene_type:complete
MEQGNQGCPVNNLRFSIKNILSEDSHRRLMEQEDVHLVDLNRSTFNRTIWFILGLISTSIGLVGIIIPGLPTTPLMILAGACFAKSSQRFYDWIIDNKMFGEHVRNYREGNGISQGVKPKILFTMWVFILFAVFYAIPEDVLISRISTLILGIIGTIFILRIPSFEH